MDPGGLSILYFHLLLFLFNLVHHAFVCMTAGELSFGRGKLYLYRGEGSLALHQLLNLILACNLPQGSAELRTGAPGCTESI